MENRRVILDMLGNCGIAYTLHEHAPVHTIEDCLLIGGIDWSRTEVAKNAFLCNRQKTDFYLMLLCHGTPFRTAIVSKALGVSRLSFAPDEALPGMLGLEAGAVSPLGLYFDRQRRVTLVADEGLKRFESLAFHPCDNTATVVMRAGDFWDVFLRRLGRTPVWVSAKGEGLV